MRLECNCGKRFLAADRPCPACGGALRPALDPVAGLPAGGVDVQVLLRQKEALRDELRVRDRQLRQAMNRIRALELLSAGARGPVPSAPAGRAVEAVRVDLASTDRMGLPSDRLELPPLPVEEVRDLKGAVELPSDRVPLFEERMSQP